MFQSDRGFILLCDNRTEEECLRRNLFGDKAQRLQDLNAIKPGDIGFLLNFDKDELIGIFRACSKAQINIEPAAWGRRFPAQVRVELVGELQRVRDATFILDKAGVGMRPMASGVCVPSFPVHERDTIQKILTHFKEPSE